MEGLNPQEPHSAGIACWYTGPQTAIHEWPNNRFFGSYVASGYGTTDKFEAPYALHNNTNSVVNNTDGSIVGYKYFNFDATKGRKDAELQLTLTPEGIDGTIEIMADRPWTSQGGKLLGSIKLKADTPNEATDMKVILPDLGELEGKHAIFLKFSSPVKDKSICTLNSIVFK